MVNRSVNRDRGLAYLASWIQEQRQEEAEAEERRSSGTSWRRRRTRGTAACTARDEDS